MTDITRLEHPRDNEKTLCFLNSVDNTEIAIAFGYLADDKAQHGYEPTAALFHDDKLVLIPVAVLAIAISQGWDEDYSWLCEDGPDYEEENDEYEAFANSPRGSGAVFGGFGVDEDSREDR